jgi:23S rRNA-intervening sequence protein
MSLSGIQSFRDLDAWQAAMELMVTAYKVAARLPPSERFGLTRRLAVLQRRSRRMSRKATRAGREASIDATSISHLAPGENSTLSSRPQ